jgi:hypothetical protein
MFWPGSEELIGGRRGTYWMPFDNDMPHADRVKHILDWLRLPEAERPSFLTLYFADVDNAGHRNGPDSAEVKDAVLLVDKSIGDLVAGVQQIGLGDRVNYVVVSDHGMAALSPDRTIVLDDYIDVTADGLGAGARLDAKDGNIEKMYGAQGQASSPCCAKAARYLPNRLAGHPRLAIFDRERRLVHHVEGRNRWAAPDRRTLGTHGDPRLPSMHGLFIANGPRIRRT